MVVLRMLVAADAEELADWGLDDEFRAAAGWSDRDRDDLVQFYRDLIGHSAVEGHRLAVRDHDQLVGYVDFTPDDTGSCELGIAIGPRTNWGRGYGRQAIATAVEHARHQFAAGRIWARTHASNTAARRLLTAAGFTEIGTCGTEDYRGETVDVITYEYGR